MRVRINIPAWGWREIAAGAAALARGGRDAGSRARLSHALEAAAPGWAAVPVSSARYAVALAVRALGLAGKRVAVPAYVCPAVLTGLGAAPAEAVPVDCAPSSLRFDAAALTRAARSGAIDAVLAPNTYGVDQDFAVLPALGLPVVEDAAYQIGCVGAAGRPCGTRGDAGVWSFNFKALTAAGGGVLLVRARDALAGGAARTDPREALRFANYAARAVARHRIPSFLPGAPPPSRDLPHEARAALGNLREAPMSELQAAVALVQWERRDRLASRQREHVAALARAVEAAAAIEPLAAAADSIAHLYPCLLPSCDEVYETRRTLHRKGIQTEEPYPVPWERPERFPNAHDVASRLLLVPCNASLGTRQIGAICRALEEARRP